MQVGGIQSGSAALATAVSKVSTGYFDPKDTNQDGVVSAAEELAYSLEHPELAAQASSLSQYTQSGTLSAGTQGASSSFSLYA